MEVFVMETHGFETTTFLLRQRHTFRMRVLFIYCCIEQPVAGESCGGRLGCSPHPSLASNSPALELLFTGASWYSTAKVLGIILRGSWKGSILLPTQESDTGTAKQKMASYFLPGYTICFTPSVPSQDCSHPITPQQLMSHCCAPSVLIQLREHMPGNMFV